MWPFPLRPSLDPLAEPLLAPGIWWGFGWASLALILLLAAWPLRRWRWPLLSLAGFIAAALAWPRLDLLLVPATPTSYARSPTGFSAAAIARGEALYNRSCAPCHGEAGYGDGPEAAKSPVPPADLTASHLWDHPDGDLFWWIGHGMTGVSGDVSMPGFEHEIAEDDRWALVDFLHANAAGAELAQTGGWGRVVFAPEVTARCADGGPDRPLAAFRGKPLLLVVPAGSEVVAASAVATVVLGGGQAPVPGVCVAEEATAAYSVVVGALPPRLPGSRFLVSPEGWLLAHWPSGSAPPPESMEALAENLRSLCLTQHSVYDHGRHATPDR